jgi:hypothetical protein
MDQAILMHADIDKRAEVGDVGDRTFQPCPAAGRSWFQRRQQTARF